MASDTGSAKAKDTSKDTSTVQLDECENSSSAVNDNFAPAKKEKSIPTQYNSSSTSIRLDPSPSPQERDNSSPQTRNAYTTTNSVNVPVNPDDRRLQAELNSRVAERAYEIYEQSGARHGDDLFHWLTAESEILTRIPEIQQTDSSFSVIAPLHGFSAEDISVTVEPNRAFILADKQHSFGQSDSDNSDSGSFSSRRSAFFVTDWPGQVDPATATAQIKQGNLVLTVKRAGANSQESKNPQTGR